MRPAMLLVPAVALAGLVLAFGLHRPSPVPPPVRATLLPTPRPLPSVALEGSQGERVDSGSLAGRWHLAYVGYTSCPDLCPTTLATLARAAAQVGTAQAPDVVFIAVDRRRDAPHLAEYVAHFGPTVRALTGDEPALGTFVHALGGYYRIPAGADPTTGYPVEHSAHVFLIDPSNRLVGVLAPPHEASIIAEDVRRIQQGSR